MVIYCSYLTHFAGNDLNVRALQMLRDNVFVHARQHVFISSLSAVRGESRYAVSKRAAERLFRNDLILRPGLVLGPGGLFFALSRKLKSSALFPLFDWGADLVSVIAIEDLCRGAEDLINTVSTGTYHLVNRRAPSFRELCEGIRGRAATPIFLPMPSAPLLWASSILRSLGSPHAAYVEDRLQGLKHNHSIAIQRDELPNLMVFDSPISFTPPAIPP